jgi:L-ascorbate metabolism protein UlaG (beta-lactamase superfamily)
MSLEVCWLRTSCLLIRAGGFTILTDPWFGRTMRGLPVFRRPGIALEDLPKIDLVLGSHLHRDHFDPKAVARLGHSDLRIVGTPGTESFVAQHIPRDRYADVRDLAPWTATQVGPVTLHATPAQHTGPPPAEVNHVIDLDGWRLFFGGDARRSHHHADIAERYGGIDVALLPIGGTLIFGHRTTLDPHDAVHVCGQLQPTWAVPIHEGGEWLPVPPASWHPGRCREFGRLSARSGLDTRAVVLKPGQWATFDGIGFEVAS